MNAQIQLEEQKLGYAKLAELCFEEMRAMGFGYETTYPIGFFEERLQATFNTRDYNLGLTIIRKALEGYGFYLSGQGTGQQFFKIIPKKRNHTWYENFTRKAKTFTARAHTLMSNTTPDGLTDQEFARVQRAAEKAATRLALFGRKLPPKTP